MADQSESTLSWMSALTEVQRRSWDTWCSLAQQSTRAGASSVDPWAMWRDAMTRWQQAATSARPATWGPVYNQVLEQGFNYLRLSDMVLSAFQSIQAAQKAGQDWMGAANRSFEQARQAVARACEQAGEFSESFVGLAGLPLDNWRRVMSSLSLLPGDMLQLLKQEDVKHLGDVVRARLEQFLSVPPLGYTREWQEQVQESARYWMDYEEALRKYNQVFGKVALRALDLFQRRIMDMAGKGERLDSLRGLYNLWIDCGEEAYAEVVSSGEYGELNARLVNASMVVKLHSQRMVDEAIGSMNMPTRRELNSAHERGQELARQVKSLQEELGRFQSRLAELPAASRASGSNDELTALRADVETLRGQLAALQAGPSTSKAQTPGARRRTGSASVKSRAPARKTGG